MQLAQHGHQPTRSRYRLLATVQTSEIVSRPRPQPPLPFFVLCSSVLWLKGCPVLFLMCCSSRRLPVYTMLSSNVSSSARHSVLRVCLSHGSQVLFPEGFI
ncbi:hypothetical protein K523DRAFT_89191 [Schizophyllum commune Tattone D]|nr:hypothetical protein K523DRAFT_89191 [Schizophyllum commune Tattone D]